MSVFGFGKENQRVEDARDLFNEIADLFDETFEDRTCGGGGMSNGWGDASGIEGNYEEEANKDESNETSGASETVETSSSTETTSTGNERNE